MYNIFSTKHFREAEQTEKLELIKQLEEERAKREKWEAEQRSIENRRKQEEDEETKKMHEKIRQEAEIRKRLEEEDRKRLEELDLIKKESLKIQKEQEIEELKLKLSSFKGFLSKQGHFVKNWKVRFCVISQDELCYYVDESRTLLKGKYPLKESTVEDVDVVGREL
jgi:hypothetical protein